jgi:hypothetical protein
VPGQLVTSSATVEKVVPSVSADPVRAVVAQEYIPESGAPDVADPGEAIHDPAASESPDASGQVHRHGRSQKGICRVGWEVGHFVPSFWRAAADGVAVTSHVHAVFALLAEQLVVAGPSDQLVVAGTTPELVVAGPAEEVVPTALTAQAVVTDASAEQVVPASPEEGVVAGTAVHGISAPAPTQQIAARPPMDDVAPTSAADHIRAPESSNGIAASGAPNHVGANGPHSLDT